MHDQYSEQLSLYALGALTGDEALRFEEHLAAGCADCERELCSLERAVSVLAYASPTSEPPASLRSRVLESVGGSAGAAPKLKVVARSKPSEEPLETAPPARGSAGAAIGIAALLAAAAVAIVFMAWALINSGSRLDNAVRELADARSSDQSSKEAVERQKDLLGLLADPAAKSTLLTATEGGAPVALNVVWQPQEKRGVLVARDLPAVGADKTYELWLVSGKTPVPAALFNTDAKGAALVPIDKLPDAGEPNVFAITVEPAGGTKLPTGKILAAGQYAGV